MRPTVRLHGAEGTVSRGKLDVGALEGSSQEGGCFLVWNSNYRGAAELESEDDRWRQAEGMPDCTYRATGRVVGVGSSGGDLPDDDELSSEQFAELEARVNAGVAAES